jgi:hypothetical protein
MLERPLKREELPDGAKVLSIEKCETGFQVLIFGIDNKTKAACIESILEVLQISDAVDYLATRGPFYFPLEEGPNIRYLTSDTLSLTEAAEACVGISAFRFDQKPQWSFEDRYIDGRAEGAVVFDEKHQPICIIPRNLGIGRDQNQVRKLAEEICALHNYYQLPGE